MNTTTAQTVRVTCDCDTCKANAERVGAAFPLAADVNVQMAAGCGITARNANRASKTHGLVWSAHDPSLTRKDGTREPFAAKFGPWAA